MDKPLEKIVKTFLSTSRDHFDNNHTNMPADLVLSYNELEEFFKLNYGIKSKKVWVVYPNNKKEKVTIWRTKALAKANSNQEHSAIEKETRALTLTEQVRLKYGKVIYNG